MRRRFALPFVLAVLAVLRAAGTSAQETTPAEPKAPPIPFASINCAGADRVLSDTEFLFQIIERPDMFDVIKSLIGEKAGDLKGLDRTKPFGVMMFLEPGFPPRPMPIAYIPTSDIDDLMETIAKTDFQTEKVPGSEKRYTLQGPGPKQHAVYRDGYTFISVSEVLLDEELPDPITANETLTTRYDVAISLRIKALPPILRDVFLGFLRSQTEAELQRKDDEPEGAYRARRANGISTLEAIEELLTEGDQITLGIDGNQESRKAVIELNLQATPDSSYAKTLKDFAARPSYFHSVQQDNDKPLTVAVSWQWNKREITQMSEMVEALRLEMDRVFKEQQLDPLPTSQLCDILKSTVEEGHVDAFVQISVPQPGHFVVTGGLKLQGAEAASPAITQLLSEVTTLPQVKGISTNQETHQGIAFHRISPEGEDQGAKNFFGGQPSFWFGTGQRALWFAAGADDAIPTLKDSIDRVLGSGPAAEGKSTPFVLVLRRAQWLSIPVDADRPWQQERREVAEQAFNKTNDTLRVETRPTENGVRTRVELDEGFIRWLGLSIVRQYDRSQL